MDLKPSALAVLDVPLRTSVPDGNGVLTHNSSELRNIVQAGDPTHASHKTSYANSTMSLCELQNLDVPCTYANMTLANAPCLVMPQPVTTNGWEEITVNGNTFNSPNVTVKANYRQAG